MTAPTVFNAYEFISGEDVSYPLEGVSAETFLSRVLYAVRQTSAQTMSHAQIFDELKKLGTKRVCQYQFKRNDIVWVCRQCESDDTCVQCNECFQASNHKGHDVFFYHTHSGGCCDCGDPAAWNPQGFCSRHGRSTSDPLHAFPEDILASANGLINVLVDGIITYWEDFHRCCLEESTEGISSSTVLNLVLLNDDVHTVQDVNRALGPFRMEADARAALIQQVDSIGHAIVATGTYSEISRLEAVLRRSKLFISLVPASWKQREINVSKAISWLKTLAATSDAMCRIICSNMLSPQISRILMVDSFLPKVLSEAIHNLFLALMADTKFKESLAVSYADCYSTFADYYSKGIGTTGCNIFGVSVQFLNRDYYVTRLIQDQDFLKVLSNALSACLSMSPSFDLEATSIKFRRFSPISADMKLAFSIPGISRCFVSQCLPQFLKIFTSYQLMHVQKRQVARHVEFEDIVWGFAFNLYICLFNVVDSMLNWIADESSTKEIQYEPDLSSPLEGVSTSSLYLANRGTNTAFNLISASSTLESALTHISNWAKAYYTLLPTQTTTTIRADICYQSNSKPSVSANSTKSLTFINVLESMKTESEPNPTEEGTFHILLHRFYASILKEMLCFPHHVQGIVDHFKKLQTSSDSLIAPLVYFPMQVLRFSARIKHDFWVRNGRSMNDQLLNYEGVPFNRIFRSLDILLIQCISAASIVSVDSSSSSASSSVYACSGYPVVRHIFHEIAGSAPKGAITFTNPRLVEESLLILIQILTEMPALPADDLEERSIPVLRRCFIHVLAHSPSTYSELLESCGFFPNANKVSSKTIDTILDEIAEKREGNGLEPLKYALKKEFWCYYDPCYPYISFKSHNNISESRPKITSNQSMVLLADSSEIHPAFRSLRFDLITDPENLFVIRNIFKAMMIPSLSSGPKEASTTWTAFQRSLQLFTYTVDVITSPNSYSYITGSESRINDVFQFILEEETISIGETVTAKAVAIDESSPEISQSKTISLLSIILDYHSSLSSSKEKSSGGGSDTDNVKHWIGWILDKFTNIPADVSEAPHTARYRVSAIINQQRRKLDDDSAAKARALKQQKAKDRAMKKLKQSSQAFAAFVEQNGDGNDAAGHSTTSDTLNPDGRNTLTDENFDETNSHDDLSCIICRTIDNANPAMGFLALSQSSRVMHHRRKNFVFSQNSDLHISFCGHAMHFSCFDSYFAQAMTQSESQGNLIIDPEKGHIVCPLCKRLNNLLVPLPSKPLRIRKESISGVENQIEFPTLISEIKNMAIHSRMPAKVFSESSIVKNLQRAGSDHSNELLFDEHPRTLNSESAWYYSGIVISPDIQSSSELHLTGAYQLISGAEGNSARTENVLLPNTLASHPIAAALMNQLKLIVSSYTNSPTTRSIDENSDRNTQQLAEVALYTREIAMLHAVSVESVQARTWLRFMGDLVRPIKNSLGPITGFSKEQSFSLDKNLCLSLEACACTVAFSVFVDYLSTVSILPNSSENAINSEGSELTNSSSPKLTSRTGFDSLSHIDSLITCFRGIVDAYNTSVFLKQSICLVMLGATNQCAWVMGKDSWMAACAPLLTKPIYQYSVVCMAMLSYEPGPSEQCVIRARSLVKILSYAYLIQLIIESASTKHESTDTDTLPSEDFSLLPFIRGVASLVHTSINYYHPGSSTLFTDADVLSIPGAEIMNILKEWTAFLCGARNLVNRLIPQEAFMAALPSWVTSSEPETNQQFEELLSALEMSECLSLPSIEMTALMTSWMDDLLGGKADTQTIRDPELVDQALKQVLDIVHSQTVPVRPLCISSLLAPLPDSYTQLHSDISSKMSVESPVLCMACGAVLDSSKRGVCSAHLPVCSGDAGIFFIVQECSVLFMYGPRCCYAPAPYADEHGERHRGHRGRPLYLDHKRLAILSSMWLKHDIAREVIMKRSSSARVIIIGHY